MTDIMHILSPIDLFVGLISFSTGIVAAARILKKNPLRNASILLQVSLLISKMAKYYFDNHPEAREKLNTQTLAMLEKISNQLQGIKESSSDSKPVG